MNGPTKKSSTMNSVPNIILQGLPPASLDILRDARSELQQAIIDIAPDYNELSPEPQNVLRIFRDCPNPKIVLLAQDPYPTGADGYGFSNNKIKPSLKNIFACLKSQQLMAGDPSTGDLSGWVREGVMLINTALTTKKGVRGAHVRIWAPFTKKILEVLARRNHPPAFILLGDHAKSYEEMITGCGAEVFTWGHPSPLNTVNATPNHPSAFVHCPAFSRANRFLKARGDTPVNWGVLTAPPDISEVDPARGVKLGKAPREKNVSREEHQANTPAPGAPTITRDMFAQQLTEREVSEMMSSASLWLFTDGGASANGRPECRASWGVCVKSKEHGVIAERSCLTYHPSSNNRGELSAVAVAILMADDIITRGFVGEISIVYDSAYAVNALTVWSLSETTAGQPRKNVDLIAPIKEWLAPILGRITFEHIRSHKQPPAPETHDWFLWHGNDRADKLCDALLRSK